METSLVEMNEQEGEGDEESAQDQFDLFLDEIGGLSRYQMLLIATGTMVMLSGFTVTTLPIFLSATPEFRSV